MGRDSRQGAEALRKSKDLRLLAHLGTALLRTDGLPAFAATLNVASQWLEAHWPTLYPLVDEDAILRRNALNCFADPMAVVDRIRRLPLVRSRQHGTFSLRDIDRDRPVRRRQQVERRLRVDADCRPDPASRQRGQQRGVAQEDRRQDARVRRVGRDAGFDQLSAQLNKMDQALRAQLAVHPGRSESDGAAAEPSTSGGAAGGRARSPSSRGRMRSARSTRWRSSSGSTEPSSPIPLFLERAKRLVSKDFLEVLADIAPDALAQARAAGGLRDSE